MATKHTMEKLLDLAAKFVIERNGDWDHEAWEGLLADAAGFGLSVGDDFKRNLGNILEAAKFFYHHLPAEAPKKKAASDETPKKKAAPKAKAKSKKE